MEHTAPDYSGIVQNITEMFKMHKEEHNRKLDMQELYALCRAKAP